MLEYEQKRYSNGGMQQQMRREETYCSSNGYRHESEFSQSQTQVRPPNTGFLKHGSHPHKTSGYGHSHSSGHHSSGGGLMSHIGSKLNPAKFSSGRPHHQYAGGKAAGEFEREHVYYECQSSPSGMHKKERYEMSYATQGAGMGHGTGNYGGMCGTQKAEWVSKGL